MLNDPEQREEYDQIRAMGSGARFSAPGAGPGAASTTSSAASVRAGRPVGRVRRLLLDVRPTGRRLRVGRFGQTTGGFRGFGGPQKGADVTARTTIDFVTAAKGETITLQGEDNVPFKVKIPPASRTGRRSACGVGDAVSRRRRERRHRRDGRGASSPGVHPRRTQPARHGPGDLHRGGARRDDRGPHPRRRRGAAARRPGTPSGRVLRVKGRGIETTKGHGDLLAEVQVAVPAHLDDAAREALERFQALEPKENPRADLMSKAR